MRNTARSTRVPANPGVVTLDETPIGWFLELEGSPDWIDKTARQLGFSEEDYVILSYAALYLTYCNEQRDHSNTHGFSMKYLREEPGVAVVQTLTCASTKTVILCNKPEPGSTSSGEQCVLTTAMVEHFVAISIIIIVFSTALFVYWFRYTCV